MRLTLAEADLQTLLRCGVVTQAPDVTLALVSRGVEFSAVCSAMAEAIGPMRVEADTEEVRRWVHGINQEHPDGVPGFLQSFAAAVCRADGTQYPLLRPALMVLKQKYPEYRFEGAL
jgi:hypothetical protein